MIIPDDLVIAQITLTFKMGLPESFVKSSQMDGNYIPHPLTDEVVDYIGEELRKNLADIISKRSLNVTFR